jgi:ammonia channel protein AmtB
VLGLVGIDKYLYKLKLSIKILLRSKNGWLMTLGAIDFAGGTPVHVVSGFSALA